ncbi:putative small GTPase, P-loop containing nucleoside triphosphate hydrolase [Arabidopsis thaliana]
MLDIKYANHNMSIILIGNKCDLVRKRAISKEEGGEFAKQHCLPASARTSQNIEEVIITWVLFKKKLQSRPFLQFYHSRL